MNYGQLKQRIAAIMHRTDLAAQLPNFVADATATINTRFGLQLVDLVADDDTNEVLTDSYLLYLYAGLVSGYDYLANSDAATHYADLFSTVADRQNVTGNKTSTDPYLAAGVPPFIAGVT